MQYSRTIPEFKAASCPTPEVDPKLREYCSRVACDSLTSYVQRTSAHDDAHGNATLYVTSNQ